VAASVVLPRWGNSAPPNSSAGFVGHFEVRKERGKGRKEGTKGRKNPEINL